jgi:hypothetical protein
MREESREALGERLPRQPLIELESGGGAIGHMDAGDGAVERETFLHNFVEEGRSRGDVTKVTLRVLTVPIFPRQRISLV